MTAAHEKHSMFRSIPSDLPDELVEVIDGGYGSFRIERIVSRGHVSPPGFWYDQGEDEWVWLLRGSARLEITSPAVDGPDDADAVSEELALEPGDYVLLPAHMRHRVSWTAPDTDTVWLSVFLRR